jgi:hypothetical protein
MIIFLMAAQSTSVAAPVLTVSPTSLDSTSSQCTGGISNPKCTVTVSETAASQGDMTWTASSDMSDSVTFSPANGTLSPGTSVIVTITAFPCQNGSFVFSGSRGAHPVMIPWRCTPPPEQLDFTPQTINLTINNVNGLLSNDSNTIGDIEQQVKNKSFLQGRSVGLAIAYGGAPTDSDIPQAKQIAGQIYLILKMLGQDNFAFQHSAYYSNLYNLGVDSNTAEVDVYLFKQ